MAGDRIIRMIGLGALLVGACVNSVRASAATQVSFGELTAPLSVAADRPAPAPLKTTFQIRAEDSIGHNENLQQLIAKNEGRQVH